MCGDLVWFGGMKIVFVTYGRFDSNSGGHVAGFANRMADRGHRVAVFSEGDPQGAADFGPVRFHAAQRSQLTQDASTALAFDGRAASIADTVIHGWTPRESVRRALGAIRRLGPFSTLIHLEDDERILTSGHLGRSWGELEALSPRALEPLMAPSLTHPHRISRLLAAADGVTAIAAPLLALARGRRVLLRPGTDPAPAPPDPQRLRQRLGVGPQTKLIAYPGNMHPANRDEVFSLYVAVQILRRRGLDVMLVRTGEDYGPPADVAYDRLKGVVSRELGHVPRSLVLALIVASDLLIQPGAADAFNRSRLPSKLPEFFASGRPVILPAANLGLEVEDGVEAVVSRRGDGFDLADLAQALFALPERAEAIGATRRRFGKRTLDWSRSTDGLEAFYRDVLDAAGAGARQAA
ncbi:hypothetical protein BH09PSE2_BH09PSE2_06470 [soil metagenome]